MTIAASGDALIMKPLPPEMPGLAPIRDWMLSADARITNLETTITDGTCPPSAFSGGTWLTAPRQALTDLAAFGFNLFGWGNNHTLDYSYPGLEQTRLALEEAGIAAAGAGRNLFEASSPAYCDGKEARCAMLCVCSTFTPSDAAGERTASSPGRPGLNPLRYSTECTVTPAHMQALKEIAAGTQVNAFEDMMVRQGFKPDPGAFELGGIRFVEGETEGKRTIAKPADIERCARFVRHALHYADYCVVMTHSHEMPGEDEAQPDDFLVEFAHAMIDAGPCAVVGGGTHRLKPLELYKGRPIFYSLGNFIFQNAFAPLLPADFMAKQGFDRDLLASEALQARSKRATAGLTQDMSAYLSALPKMTFEDGQLIALELMPICLCPEGGKHLKGWPRAAAQTEAEMTFDVLSALSAPYGVRMALENGLIRVFL